MLGRVDMNLSKMTQRFDYLERSVQRIEVMLERMGMPKEAIANIETLERMLAAVAEQVAWPGQRPPWVPVVGEEAEAEEAEEK